MFRTFSAKLWLLISAATCVVALGSAWSIYHIASSTQWNRLRLKLVRQATMIASFVDTETLASVRTSQQQDSPEWQSIAKLLLNFQEQDPDIRYIYIMGKLPQTERTGVVEFLVDPNPDGDANGDGVISPDERSARLGDTYDARNLAPAILEAFDHPTFDRDLTKDQWGWSYSGYAPIRDRSGQTVGIVGVDIMADQLEALRRDFGRQCWVVIIAVLFTSLLISSLASWYVNKPVKALHDGIQKVQQGDLDVKVTIETRDEFHRLAEAFNAMTAGLKERQFLRDTLDRYMSRELADVVMKQGEQFFKTIERRRLTVLFCDIRGMTTLSEQRAPEETAKILSVFFHHMIEAVFRNGGIVDKLLGDGIMVLFGAPLDMPNHEEAALNCALEMTDAMAEVQRATGIPDLSIGVGVNTGSLIVGNIGSGRIMDYTVIGDGANVAARLQQETRTLDVAILASQSTVEPFRDRFRVRLMGPIAIRGRTEPVVVYSIEGRHEAAKTST